MLDPELLGGSHVWRAEAASKDADRDDKASVADIDVAESSEDRRDESTTLAEPSAETTDTAASVASIRRRRFQLRKNEGESSES